MAWRIKIHRSLLDREWYDDNNVLKVFIHLLLTANRKDKSWKGTVVKRWQKITSYRNLAKETNLSVKQIRTAISKLKRTHEVAHETTHQRQRITVVKYDLYQDVDDEEGTLEGTQLGTQRATTKEYKKKERKKKVYNRPTLEEIQDYCSLRWNSVNADKFLAHYETVWRVYGKAKTPVKDWKACVRGWEVRDKEYNNQKEPQAEQEFIVLLNKIWTKAFTDKYGTDKHREIKLASL